MKMLVIIALLLVILAGGGVAFWQYGMPMLQEVGDSEDPPMLEHTLTVRLNPMVIPMVREGQVTKHLTVNVQLQVAGLSAENQLRENLPKLRDAFLTELYSLMAMRYVQENRMQTEFIKGRLKLVADNLLGHDILHNIVIQGLERRTPLDFEKPQQTQEAKG